MRTNEGGWGKSISSEAYNTKGPKPGSTRAIPQRKAISEGTVAEVGPCNVYTYQDYTTTGGTHVPGLTNKGRM